MDLIILLAIFVAFLALAYVTYRNVYNLDSRLRKIEDILRNAQVVAEQGSNPPVNKDKEVPLYHSRDQSASVPVSAPQDVSPYAARYGKAGGDSFDGPITGWGGETSSVPPKVTVAKEEHDNVRTVDVIPDEEQGTDDDLEVDDILDEMENENETDGESSNDGDDEASSPGLDFSSVTVQDLRKALRTANVQIPSGAKKADLISLSKEHGVSVVSDTDDHNKMEVDEL
jgi:hypothetical protein